MININSLPDYEAEARKWKDLYNQSKANYTCLCEELEEMKMALDKKSAEFEKKQHECDMLLSCYAKLEGQIEAYQFCIEHWRDRL